ncbi:MAG: S-layer homology domain-containing protein, partial [Clostridia bacterium]|nr:S-layer homology domain-containing protein [Clostridia bacterium]
MVTIKLPNGRLLDIADQTTNTALYTENQKPASGLNIFIEDLNGNNATGTTDANGQLKVPNNQSNTGDDNGTIGNEVEDKKNTYVVSVTDKYNVTIPNCEIKIGESNNVVIDLPDGLILTKESPVIVTIKDHNGNPQKDVSVIVIADKDYIEKGVTDRYGKLTVPPVNSGYTDKDGKVHISGFNVIVEDEAKKIENAYVTYNDDATISVILPAETLIDYANRISVSVLDKDGVAVKDVSVTVKDASENERNGITDENGKMTVPPLSEDITDSEGKAEVNGNKITVEDENGVIPGAFIKYEDEKLSVELPEGKEITVDNRIIVTVTDSEDNPIKDMNVIVKDTSGRTESNLTDKDGKAVVPPTTFDITDKNGYGELNEYSITVVDETKPLENVSLTLNEDGSITVLLPTESKIVHTNRITVTVVNKTEKKPVKDISVTVSEAPKAEDDTQAAEPKTANGKTDENGKVIVPPLSEDITDGDGNSDVTNKEEKPGEDTNGDGTEDKPGEVITTTYNVALADTKGNIPNALVKIEDGKVYITIPDTHTLTTSNQITATVTDGENKPVANVSVTMTDKTNTSKTGTTNSNGKVTLPVKTSSGGSSGGSSYSGGGGGGGSYSSTTITVVDKDNKNVSVSKSTSTTKATLTLPTGKKLTDDNYYTITVKSSGKVKADYEVVLKDRSGNEVKGKTDANGVVMLPGKKHTAYIFGYPDSTFRPEGNMSRAEAAAIFARLISEAKGEKISGTSTSFKDVSKNEWYINYISYLEKYEIIKGYSDKTFRPDDFVSRAEFIAMT